MDENALTTEQPQHQFFLRFERRDLENRIPARLRGQAVARGRGLRVVAELRVVGPHATRDLVANHSAPAQEVGRSHLHGSRDREIGVADDFEPLQRFADERGRAGHGDPAELQLREADGFRKSPEAKRQDVVRRERTPGTGDRAVFELIVGENCSGDDSNLPFRANRREPRELLTCDQRTGRVVRTDDEDRACARRDRALEALEID